jgi:hypothetical protein
VLDFANEADDSQAAFKPYYETTLLSEATDPNPEGDFYVRSGPGSVKLSPESAAEYIKTRFPEVSRATG